MTEVRKFLGTRIESVIQVTEHVSDSRFSVHVVSGPATMEVTHSLTPIGRGTRIDVVVQAEVPAFFSVAEPIVERTIRRELEFDLSTLKDLLEARG